MSWKDRDIALLEQEKKHFLEEIERLKQKIVKLEIALDEEKKYVKTLIEKVLEAKGCVKE